MTVARIPPSAIEITIHRCIAREWTSVIAELTYRTAVADLKKAYFEATRKFGCDRIALE